MKRGLFILDNILGIAPAAPAAEHPVAGGGRQEARGPDPDACARRWPCTAASPRAARCHARMDPLGLALENFNALGRWRDKERGQPIDASGKLITGEAFTDVRELKQHPGRPSIAASSTAA